MAIEKELIDILREEMKRSSSNTRTVEKKFDPENQQEPIDDEHQYVFVMYEGRKKVKRVGFRISNFPNIPRG